MACAAQRKSCRLLSGREVLTVPLGEDANSCRALVARRLGMRAEHVHVFDAGDSCEVLLCDSFKVFCRDCRCRIECACDEPESACACTPVQASHEDDFCAVCRRHREEELHWCWKKDCLVCSEDWGVCDLDRSAARPKRRGPKKKATTPCVRFEDE
jgi:hypothetical protein